MIRRSDSYQFVAKKGWNMLFLAFNNSVYDLKGFSMYSTTTKCIQVTVTPEYMESQSIPSDEYFVWSYKVSIKNIGPLTIQLLHRHWKIIDEKGLSHHTSGAGVVGIQPDIRPGEEFEYTSGVHLATASGMMMGHYDVKNTEGEEFSIEIPTFSLDCPHVEMVMH